MPRITIGLPVFNRENYIADALDSLLAQTFQDFEIIITDNASTDKTGGICEEYAKNDKRITYVRNKENIGSPENFNKVFKFAAGEFFKWAASDDVCDPHFLQQCVDVFDKNKSTVLCFPKEIAIDDNGNIIPGYMDVYEKLPHLSDADPIKRFRDVTLKHHACYSVFGLIRRSILSQTSLMGGYIGSDRVLLAQLALLGQIREVDAPIYFRRHEGQYCALETDEARMTWFDPKFSGTVPSTHYRYLCEYAKTIGSLSPTTKEKIRGYLYLAEWMLRKRKMLFRETVLAKKRRKTQQS